MIINEIAYTSKWQCGTKFCQGSMPTMKLWISELGLSWKIMDRFSRLRHLQLSNLTERFEFSFSYTFFSSFLFSTRKRGPWLFCAGSRTSKCFCVHPIFQALRRYRQINYHIRRWNLPRDRPQSRLWFSHQNLSPLQGWYFSAHRTGHQRFALLTRSQWRQTSFLRVKTFFLIFSKQRDISVDKFRLLSKSFHPEIIVHN